MAEQKVANKVRYNLKNVHYAKLKYDTLQSKWGYEKPVPIPGAVSIALSKIGEMVKFYADGILYYCADPKGGKEGDLEIARIPESFVKDILGASVDSKGMIVETTGDKTSPFALLFEFEGDQKAQRHCLYHCFASQNEENGNTTEGSIEVATEKLNIVSSPSPYFEDANGKRLLQISTGDSADQTTYDAWYDAVPMPNAVVG